MGKLKTYGCELEDDNRFVDMWTRMQTRSIWGDRQQQKPRRADWADQMTPMTRPKNIGTSTRPLNFNAVPKEEPSRMLKFPRHRDRDTTK